MERPTLEDQIRASKMSREELIDLFMPHTFREIVNFWIFRHCELLWHIINWNWFDLFEGLEDADQYRSWYIKLKRRLWGGNKK